MNQFPKPIDDQTIKPALPGRIIVERSGLLTVRHYYGNSGQPTFNRLWIVAPARHAQEVTTAAGSIPWPGNEVTIHVEAGEEVIVRLSSMYLTFGGDPAWEPNSGQARVFDVTPDDEYAWGRYIEWEDLDIVPPYGSANGYTGGADKAHFNDSRTLVYVPQARGFIVGTI